jgi:hypothetical protein
MGLSWLSTPANPAARSMNVTAGASLATTRLDVLVESSPERIGTESQIATTRQERLSARFVAQHVSTSVGGNTLTARPTASAPTLIRGYAPDPVRGRLFWASTDSASKPTKVWKRPKVASVLSAENPECCVSITTTPQVLSEVYSATNVTSGLVSSEMIPFFFVRPSLISVSRVK